MKSVSMPERELLEYMKKEPMSIAEAMAFLNGKDNKHSSYSYTYGLLKMWVAQGILKERYGLQKGKIEYKVVNTHN